MNVSDQWRVSHPSPCKKYWGVAFNTAAWQPFSILSGTKKLDLQTLQSTFSYHTVLKYCSIIYQYDVKHVENLRLESFQGVLFKETRYLTIHILCVTL